MKILIKANPTNVVAKSAKINVRIFKKNPPSTISCSDNTPCTPYGTTCNGGSCIIDSEPETEIYFSF